MINRIEPPEGEMIPQWQTIYCSLMLLLVVFFVMLIAYSSVDKDRFANKKYIETKAKESFSNAPDMNRAMESMEKLIANLGMKRDYPILRTEDGFKAVVSSPVLFNSGDDSLNKNVLAVLDGIREIAKRNDLEVQIEGHTDNIPINTNRFPSNWELSTMRAANILRYLQKNGAIPSNRLVAVGFAEYQPIAGNESPEGRQKNRRIEILFRSAK